jgi:probable rRNA maturation factor
MVEKDNSHTICSCSTNSPNSGPIALTHRLLLTVVREGGDWRSFGDCETAVHAVGRALTAHFDCAVDPDLEAAVVLAADARVQELNRTYRHKDAPTNVLSFPFQVPPGGAVEVGEPVYLGDVVLAAETIRKEAEERGIVPVRHLQHLVVHGLLHLLGYDHGHDADAEVMEHLEVKILARLGVSDPYASPQPVGTPTL